MLSVDNDRLAGDPAGGGGSRDLCVELHRTGVSELRDQRYFLDREEEEMEKWTVYTNSIAGERIYTVGRIIDESKPLHGGNFESDSCHTSKADAQARCDELNRNESK